MLLKIMCKFGLILLTDYRVDVDQRSVMPTTTMKAEGSDPYVLAGHTKPNNMHIFKLQHQENKNRIYLEEQCMYIHQNIKTLKIYTSSIHSIKTVGLIQRTKSTLNGTD